MNISKLNKMQNYNSQREGVRKITRLKGSMLQNLIGGFFIILFLLPHLSQAQDNVQPGKFIIEPPTLINLGFEWYIDGDDNRNATVKVEYRIAGSGNEWKKGMSLLRIGGEHIGRAGIDYTTPHMFAGSILDLNSNTKYEARFTLEDPDGVEGEEVKVVNVSTRAEPKAASGGRVRHVYSQYYTGEKEEPNYPGLVSAYNGSENTKGDWYVISEDKVQPGDIIKIHGGLYEGVLLNYPDWNNIPFDGTYFFTAKGTAERPIVIEAAGDGEVIFDGAGAANLFNVMATEHHIFQGLTFRNVGRVFDAGRKHLTGASDLTVRNCRFENVGEGIRTEYAGSKNFLIQDNVILGRDDRYRVYGWAAHREGLIPYGTHLLDSYYGIKVYGSGHVIAHNSIAYFHDAIGISTYGTPEVEQELKAVSIDIYNNDLHLQVDDFIEADGGVHNIRIMRNRGVNTAENGISAQPVFGGPAYYIRNILYNVPLGGALKIHGGVPGLTAYHNTFITENNAGARYPNSNFRNNLILGTDGPVVVSSLRFSTDYSIADYNGYRPNQGPDSPENQFRWLTPEGEEVEFKALESFSQASGLEAHGITVDYDVFEDLQKPIHALERGKPSPVYHAVDLNFKLNPKGKAVDAGVFIPNVNDNFNGKAPDLGALEVGSPAVIYGVRGLDQGQEFYR
jgi:hypothetical protein